MDLVCQRDAHLARAQFLAFTIDLKLASAFQDKEYLMSQIVAVRLGNLTGLHFHKAGANLWRYQDIADIGSVIIDGKAHFDNLLLVFR
jgi:hypothetical protein